MMKYIAAHSRDNARTPMQWSAEKNAGFSECDPWFHVNPAYEKINVELALADPNSIFYYYQKLIELRHTLPVITDGKYELVAGNELDEEVYAYTRKDAETTLLIILNYGKEEQNRHYELPEGAKLLVSNYGDDKGDLLRAYEAKVYQF